MISNEQNQFMPEADEASKKTEVMHFGEISASTPNVKRGMKEMFAKRFGQKITAMLGKKQVSTYSLQKNLSMQAPALNHRATFALGRPNQYPSQISGVSVPNQQQS